MAALDCACDNAGIEGLIAPFVDQTEENFDNTIAINLKGDVHVPQGRDRADGDPRRGAIVNVASIAGLIGFPGLAAYVASKHGVRTNQRRCA